MIVGLFRYLVYRVHARAENYLKDNGSNRIKAIPHNSKCRYGERGAADAKPKAQIILDVLSSILATQMPCRSRRSGALSRKAGIVRCCLK